jgi:uncharacterized delta-60 repeat protein
MKKQKPNSDNPGELSNLEELQKSLQRENQAWKKLLENLERLKNSNRVTSLNLFFQNPNPSKFMCMNKILLTLTLCLGIVGFSYSQNAGDLDPTFGNGGIALLDVENLDVFHHLLIQSDEKIVAAGMSFDQSYVSTAIAARYLPDGTLDASFGNNGTFSYNLDFEANIYRSALTADGSIILTGSTTDYTNYRVLLMKLTPDGVLDPAFGDNGVVLHNFSDAPAFYESHSYGLAIDSEGYIILSGNTLDADYMAVPMVARFTPEGQLDETFGDGGVVKLPASESSSNFDALEVLPNGKIVAAGSSGEGLLFWVMLVAQFNSDGSLDESFGTNGIAKFNIGNVDDEVYDIAFNAEGELYLTGFSATVNYTFRSVLMKVNTDGTLDTSFGDNGIVMENLGDYTVGSDVELLSDGQLMVGGTSGEGPPNTFHTTVWKYNPNGTPYESFGEGGVIVHMIPGRNAFGEGLAIQADGKALLSGQARVDGQNSSDAYIMRLENSFVSAVNEAVYAAAPLLSPNPVRAGSILNINLQDVPQAESVLEIYDITGKRVAAIDLQNKGGMNSAYSLSVPSNLSEGLYLVRVSDSDFTTTASRLVITR